MKAKTVNETINFQRGRTPKESVQIGEIRNRKITKALLDNKVSIGDRVHMIEWLDTIPPVKRMYGIDDNTQLYGFDVENYSEILEDDDIDVDFVEILDDESVEILDSELYGNPPIRYDLHLLKDGTKVIYYNGFSDGLMSKEDWINK